MHNVRKVTDDLYWVGASDRRLALFENIHPLPEGVSYNAYVLTDEKTVLIDTADWSVGKQFIENVEYVLAGKPLDVLIVNHFEPDHAATLGEILLRYPDVTVVTTAKGKSFAEQFGYDIKNADIVKNGDTRSFGAHEFTFVAAPMVHWPEVMVSFDHTNGVLFSADAFGSFKALDGKLFDDEVDYDRDWIDEARRYYANIVGKYGKNVTVLLKKAAPLDIKMICPLHGLIWRSGIDYILDKHQKWASYTPEEQGVVIAYASMYGDTENAADILAVKLAEAGVKNVKVYDVSKTDRSYIISDMFKYSHFVLASVTYNLGIFPTMHDLISDMKALNVSNRTAAIIENGTWAVKSGTLMQAELESMKDITLLDEKVSLLSSVKEDGEADLSTLADAIAASVKA
ncbi:MAG: FprA family A-type flavoprotein [Eubacteriaceae bacterium]|nr:FprA family A-type flavoprotein [Eubacteriaceae bacterium]